MQETLLAQGIDLMLYGMGTVFVFLAVLVVVTNLMSLCMVRYFPEAPEPLPKAKAPQVKSKQGVDAKTLAIIKAAIDLHRSKQNR